MPPRYDRYFAQGGDWGAVITRRLSEAHADHVIGAERIHFVHARSPEPGATPIVITHGWPGSVVEFLEIIDPLRDPRSHGGDPGDALHVGIRLRRDAWPR